MKKEEEKKMGNGNKVTKSLTVKPEFLLEPMALGDIFMKSGMFKDIKTQAQAVVKILAGKELGLAPLESMTNIYMVNGKVALQAKLIGALIKKSTKYDYVVNALDEKKCEMTFYSLEEEGKKVEVGKSVFTLADAAKAGIVNKDVWKAYPRNMLFARALSNGARWYTSDVFCGYTAEELEAPKEVSSIITVDGKGKVKHGA